MGGEKPRKEADGIGREIKSNKGGGAELHRYRSHHPSGLRHQCPKLHPPNCLPASITPLHPADPNPNFKPSPPPHDGAGRPAVTPTSTEATAAGAVEDGKRRSRGNRGRDLGDEYRGEGFWLFKRKLFKCFRKFPVRKWKVFPAWLCCHVWDFWLSREEKERKVMMGSAGLLLGLPMPAGARGAQGFGLQSDLPSPASVVWCARAGTWCVGRVGAGRLLRVPGSGSSQGVCLVRLLLRVFDGTGWVNERAQCVMRYHRPVSGEWFGSSCRRVYGWAAGWRMRGH